MVGVHRAGRNWSTIKGKMYDGVRMSNSILEGERNRITHVASVRCDGSAKFHPGCCYRHFKKRPRTLKEFALMSFVLGFYFNSKHTCT